MLEPAIKDVTFTFVSGIAGNALFAFSHAMFEAAHKADLTRIFPVRRQYVERDLSHLVKPEQLSELTIPKLIENTMIFSSCL